MKNILVPVDFSPVSIAAVEFALGIARKSKAKIILLNSTFSSLKSEMPGVYYDIVPLMSIITQTAKNQLEDIVKNLDAEVEIETMISGLHLISAVNELIAEDKINLVVMGTNGTSSWAERFIGSNTEKMVRRVKCPIIAVPTKVSVDSIKKILVPVDIKEIQDELLKRFVSMQKFFNAELEFVWVRTPHNTENEETIRENFSFLMDRYGLENYKLGIVSRIFPAEGILEYAFQSRANMIAMATHSRRGIAHLFASSITEDTINQISIPVWTYQLDKDAKNISLVNIQETKTMG